MRQIGIERALPYGYDEALAKIPAALKAEGFGVLTEIDVSKVLEQKLGVEFRRYKILGACNPKFAHRALDSSLGVGVMLPCNVVVYENDDDSATVIAVDPMQTLAANDSALAEIAKEVQAGLRRVVDAL